MLEEGHDHSGVLPINWSIWYESRQAAEPPA